MQQVTTAPSEPAGLLSALQDEEHNSLYGLVQRRRMRNAMLSPGWKRNAWILLVSMGLLMLAIFSAVIARTIDDWQSFRSDSLEIGTVLLIVVLVPGSMLWLLGGIFGLCRDSIGWLSLVKQSGGAQLLDSMTCISPISDQEILTAGIRINVVPLWPRILLASTVFSLCFMLPTLDNSGAVMLQSLMFLPLSIVAMTLSGMLGSICLALFLNCIGLLQRHALLVALLSLALAGLQFFAAVFGSALFADGPRGRPMAMDLWPLVPLGLLTGCAVFFGSALLAFRERPRRNWLMLALPLLVPVVFALLFLTASIVGGFMDEEPFAAFFGNMMWVYNAFLPFSPFSSPSLMLRGEPLLESWNALAFEFWRYPLLLALQLLLLRLLWRLALQATADRRTPLVDSAQ
ncbi:MAG: hypothetical protein R3F46_00600 [bacterium]